jgi:hypothetical protein
MIELGYSCKFESDEFKYLIQWLKETTKSGARSLSLWEIGGREITRTKSFAIAEAKEYARHFGIPTFYRTMKYAGPDWFAAKRYLHGAESSSSDVLAHESIIVVPSDLIAIELRLTFSYVTQHPFVHHYD